MVGTIYNLENEEKRLISYLQKTSAVNEKREFDDVEVDKHDDSNSNFHGDESEFIGRRVYCCETSRSLYCPECCKVLVPKELWPRRFIRQQINKGNIYQKKANSSFPFDSMDIILGVKERRTSSTGIQMMCISNMVADIAEVSLNDLSNQNKSEEKKSDNLPSEILNIDRLDDDANAGEWWRNIKLFDLNRGDVLPQYSASVGKEDDTINSEYDTHEDNEGTYVLFPQEGKSVPISTVANKIKRLVVLDIKWTRSYNVQLFSADHHKIMVSRLSDGGGGKCYNPLAPLKDLPFVHLEHPPENSHFWRWHNRGVGMLSTIEAVYFAAREVSVARHGRRDIGEGDDKCDNGCGEDESNGDDDDNDTFVDILWLFALQRSIIQERSLQEGRPVAFSEEAKAQARALRKQDRPEKV